MLDDQTLEAFDRALSEKVPYLRAQMHPGLSRDEIEKCFSAIGVRPSQEACAWWERFGSDSTPQVLPDMDFLPLAISVRSLRSSRALSTELATRDVGGRIPELWHAQWVPVFYVPSGGDVVLDCEGDGPLTPLRYVNFHLSGEPEFAAVIAPSLGAFISKATAWLRDTDCHYDPERGVWLPFELWMDDLASWFKPMT